MAEDTRSMPSFFIDNLLQRDSGRDTLNRADPGLHRADPGIHRADPGLPGLHHSDPGLHQSDPGLHHSDPGLHCSDPGVQRLDPGVPRASPNTDLHPGPYTLPPGPVPQDAANADPTQEALNYHVAADGAGRAPGTEAERAGTLLPGEAGPEDGSYHDSLCAEYGRRTAPRSPAALVHYGDGGVVESGGCGGERREESMLDASCSTHGEQSVRNVQNEPKPEVSDLVAGDDGKKRPRTAFSAEQVRSLEQEFQRSKYLSVSKRTEMSRQLGLTEQQIKIWFQNRRTKWKRKYTNNLEILAQQHYLRMGLLPAYPFHSPGSASKPTPAQYGGVFGAGVGGVRSPFPAPQPAVRLYPPFTPGPGIPRM